MGTGIKSSKTHLAAWAVVSSAGLAAALVWLPQLRGSWHGGSPREISVAASAANLAPTNPTAPTRDTRSSANVTSTQSHQAITWVRTIRELPENDVELEAAHSQGQPDQCELIPTGKPVRITGFQPSITKPDDRESAERVPVLSNRRHIFSVGLDMFSVDQEDLPMLSGQQILKYLHSNFITVQVRVQKDPITGALFLHQRPLAAMAKYAGNRLTQDVNEGLTATLESYRGLGLFLPPGAEPTPENLRTMVLLLKGERAANAEFRPGEPKYEFVFVRAREERGNKGPELSLHTFATADDRSMLHYLDAADSPRKPSECTLQTMIYFTSYSHAGLYPAESATRTTQISDRASYSMNDLTAYADAQGWDGTPFSHLDKLLDALIDGRVPRGE